MKTFSTLTRKLISGSIFRPSKEKKSHRAPPPEDPPPKKKKEKKERKEVTFVTREEYHLYNRCCPRYHFAEQERKEGRREGHEPREERRERKEKKEKGRGEKSFQRLRSLL